MSKNIKFLDKEKVFSGEYIDCIKLTFLDSQDQIKIWEYVERKSHCKAASAIVHNIDEFILIKEFRHSVQKFIIDFPAGLIDSGEEALEAAIREFEEETGFRQIGVKHSIFGPSYSNVGLTNERVYTVVFDTEYLHPIKQKLDRTEIIEVIKVSDKDFLKTILNCQTTDTEIGSRLLNFAIGFDYGQRQGKNNEKSIDCGRCTK